MWADEHINFVIRNLGQEDYHALGGLGELRGLQAAVEKICDEGEALHNTGSIPDALVRQKKEELFSQYPAEARSEPEKILALLFFQIGLAHQGSPAQSSASADEEEANRDETVEAIRRRRFSKEGACSGTATGLAFPAASRAINEEYVSAELAKAQQARWKCHYGEVLERVAHLQGYLWGYHSITANYWKAKLLDLQVETTFTVSERPQFSRVLERAETAVRNWTGLHDPIALTHAYLRQSVIHRQRFTESQSKFRQVDGHIHDSLLSLYQAEGETLPYLKRLDSLSARNTVFAVYNDLAKSLSHAREIESARRYLQRAQAVCAELEDLAPRRALDLAITQSIFVREFFIAKNIFGHVGQLDALAESITSGLNYPLDSADLVLHEMLWKSYIPVLVSTGRREQAEEIFTRCKNQARQHSLYNQLRDLSYLARALQLRYI